MVKGTGRSSRKSARSAIKGAPRAVVPSLSTDWYWEQDAELRFTRVQVRSGDPVEQALAERIIGKQRWETGIEIEGGWDEHRAALEARAPFQDVLMWRELEDGTRRYVLTSGEPVFDAKGRFTGYRGIGRDVTAQKRVERLLRLEHRITRRLAEHAPPQQALGRALQVLCETEGWDCGEIWKLDERASCLRRYAEWFNPQAEGAREFIEGSSRLTFSRGEGLIGTVWQTGEPIWVPDWGTDPRAARKTRPESTSLHAAVRFPIWTGGSVTAVLAVTSRRMRAPHKRLHQALHVIAAMIGQYLERTAAEQAVRESEARFRSLTALSSDWYWEQDSQFRFTRLEGRYVTGGDESLRARLIGTQRWESGLEIEGGWDAHRAALEARQPFHDVLMWRELADGNRRFMQISGEPIFAADGKFAGYRGVGRDVTAQKRGELLLRLEHRVAGVLAAAEFSSSGLIEVIRAVCEAEHWACGRYFQLDEQANLLRFQDAWCILEPGFRQFVERSHNLTYAPGEGLVGKVLQTGEPMWSADTRSDARVREKSLAEGTGIRGGFAFAAVSGGRTIGVLTFSSPKLREPDQRLLEASRVIGSQIGQFLQRKRAEESLRASEGRFRALTQMSSDFFWETDAAHRFTQLAHGPDYPHIHMGEEACWPELRAALERQLPLRDFEFARRMPDGEVRYFSVSGEPHFAADGAFLGYRGVGRDTTEIALARERISSLAYSDPLTGLANRTSLGPALEQAVMRARRRHAKLAVVFIDLDGFKQVNDLHGHDAGDALLVEMASRLRKQLRASDLVARLGGDEFLVVLEEIHDAAPVEAVARKLLGELKRPYALGGAALEVTASIGVSVLPDDATDAPALMKHADTAMYAAKQAGKNTLCFYGAVAAANDPAGEKSSAADPARR
jgi:diguanylate cyclase (GGDEF)-like protein/PAS domain S-box-containing protein